MPEETQQGATPENHEGAMPNEQQQGAKPDDDKQHDESGQQENDKSREREDADPENLWQTIENQRKTERKLTKQIQRLEEQVKQHENAKLSEQERLQRELEETRSERDTLVRDNHLMRAQRIAADAGAMYPDLIADKIPAEALEDESLSKQAVNDLKKNYPNLFRSSANGSADGGAGSRAVPRVSINDMIRRKAGRS
jgi:hypothetical protein